MDSAHVALPRSLGVRLILLPIALAGCPSIGDSFRADALDRAAFELRCPKEQLKIVGLNVPLDNRPLRVGAQVGVDGCGQRVVYVLSDSAGWVVNTASGTEKSPDAKP